MSAGICTASADCWRRGRGAAWGSQIVAHFGPIDAPVSVSDGWVPMAVQLTFGAHENHRGSWEDCVESPREARFGTGEGIGASPESLRDIDARASHTAENLIVSTGHVADGTPWVWTVE